VTEEMEGAKKGTHYGVEKKAGRKKNCSTAKGNPADEQGNGKKSVTQNKSFKVKKALKRHGLITSRLQGKKKGRALCGGEKVTRQKGAEGGVKRLDIQPVDWQKRNSPHKSSGGGKGEKVKTKNLNSVRQRIEGSGRGNIDWVGEQCGNSKEGSSYFRKKKKVGDFTTIPARERENETGKEGCLPPKGRQATRKRRTIRWRS